MTFPNIAGRPWGTGRTAPYGSKLLRFEVGEITPQSQLLRGFFCIAARHSYAIFLTQRDAVTLGEAG